MLHAACCLLLAATRCAVHLAPATPPPRRASLVASVNFRLGCHFNPELNDAFAFAFALAFVALPSSSCSCMQQLCSFKLTSVVRTCRAATSAD